jgi:ribose/xylose/arabinose/galactoside ABC-type transport system permease subunit
VAKLKLPAIIVTLGTLNIMRGALLLGIGSQWKSGMPAWFLAIARTQPFGLKFKITAYAWITACILTYFLIRYTIWGRRILAAGSNADASARIGFNPAFAYVMAFSYMGLMIGLGSLFYTANVGIAQPMSGMGYEMILISAAVIGGTPFSGGNISIAGTFLGVLLLGIIENGMIISKVPVYWQEMMRGIVIIAAIVFLAIKFTNNRRRGRKTIKRDKAMVLK